MHIACSCYRRAQQSAPSHYHLQCILQERAYAGGPDVVCQAAGVSTIYWMMLYSFESHNKLLVGVILLSSVVNHNL
jgi:hypothetical protein